MPCTCGNHSGKTCGCHRHDRSRCDDPCAKHARVGEPCRPDSCEDADMIEEVQGWYDCRRCAPFELRRKRCKQHTKSSEVFTFFSRRFCQPITVRVWRPCDAYHRAPRSIDASYCFDIERPIPLVNRPVDTSRLPGCFADAKPREDVNYNRCCVIPRKKRKRIQLNLPGRFEYTVPDNNNIYERACRCKQKPACPPRYVRMNLPGCLNAPPFDGGGDWGDEEPPYGDDPGYEIPEDGDNGEYGDEQPGDEYDPENPDGTYPGDDPDTYG